MQQLMMQCSPAFESSTLHPFLAELKRRANVEDADLTEEKLLKPVMPSQSARSRSTSLWRSLPIFLAFPGLDPTR